MYNVSVVIPKTTGHPRPGKHFLSTHVALEDACDAAAMYWIVTRGTRYTNAIDIEVTHQRTGELIINADDIIHSSQERTGGNGTCPDPD